MSDNREARELQACPNPWCEALQRDGDFSPQIHYSNFALVYVACTSCGMAGPTRQHEIDAITAWNTRAPQPPPASDSLARILCDDAAARVIARQERAPSFEDSEADVQDYWRALALAALSTAQSSGQPDGEAAVLGETANLQHNLAGSQQEIKTEAFAQSIEDAYREGWNDGYAAGQEEDRGRVASWSSQDADWKNSMIRARLQETEK